MFDALHEANAVKVEVAGKRVLVLIDPSKQLQLNTTEVALACSPRGLGADALVRCMYTEYVPGSTRLLELAPQAEWFIEAYAPDATALEANGELLVAAACALVEQALVKAPIDFATRAGVRSVSKLDNVWSVAGQPINYAHPALAAQAGMDSAVNLQGTNYGALRLQVPQTLNVVAQGEIDQSTQAFSGAGQWALLVSSQTTNYLTRIYTHLVPSQAQTPAAAPWPSQLALAASGAMYCWLNPAPAALADVSDSDDAKVEAADAHATSAEPSDYLVKIGDHDLAVHLDGNPFTGERALISMRANVVAQAMLF